MLWKLKDLKKLLLYLVFYFCSFILYSKSYCSSKTSKVLFVIILRYFSDNDVVINNLNYMIIAFSTYN